MNNKMFNKKNKASNISIKLKINKKMKIKNIKIIKPFKIILNKIKINKKIQLIKQNSKILSYKSMKI